MKVVLVNEIDERHLTEVKKEMLTIGTPTIDVVYDECYDFYVALEGSHRLQAAFELGLTPELNIIEMNDIYDVMCDDMYDYDMDRMSIGAAVIDTAARRYNRGLYATFE